MDGFVYPMALLGVAILGFLLGVLYRAFDQGGQFFAVNEDIWSEGYRAGQMDRQVASQLQSVIASDPGRSPDYAAERAVSRN